MLNSKKYNTTILLEDINFTLNNSEVAALIGSNGAGTPAVSNRVTGSVLAEVGVVNYSF